MRFITAVISLSLLASCGSESNTENPTAGNNTDTTVQVNKDTSGTVTESVEVEEDVVIPVPRLSVKDTSCLPLPNPRYVNWITTDSLWDVYRISDELYGYLITHFDSSSRKPMDDKNIEYNYSAAWEQSFSNGLNYSSIEWMEAGIDRRVETSCTDISQVRRVFMMIVENPDNTWNADSTSYSPDGAGCGYSFEREDDSTITISYYCGC